MKAKDKFMEMYNELPLKARGLLVLNYWQERPYSLSVISLEIRADTKLSKDLLKELGYEDD
jgi:hypothetical protein|tara:strand:+ start:431 stop:613 length:183 start_codon:yes stop_codon:yes gene_type:complete